MLNLFTDNWITPPTLNDGERMLQVITDNNMNVIYTIVGDMNEDELENELIFTLHHKFGTATRYCGYEDASYICEWHEMAQKDADEAWKGSGYYRILWSGGGDWTNNGPVWFDTKDDLIEELLAAYEHSTETRLPFVEHCEWFRMEELEEYLGEYIDEYDVDGIVDEATTTASDGNTVWSVDVDEFERIVKRHEW